MSLRAVLALLAALVLVLRGLLWLQKRRKTLAAKGGGGFRCPDCGTYRLVVVISIVLPGESDEATVKLQALACRRCVFRGVGVAIGGADRSHMGYPMSPIDHAAFAGDLARCPAPSSQSCDCAIHRRFGAREGGTWRGLAPVKHIARERFEMERSPR